MDAPHFIQVGDAPVFTGAGGSDLVCRCGQSTLIKGYLPANFLAIRIKCFRCGGVAETPGLPEGAILARSAVNIAAKQTPVVAPLSVGPGVVLACQDATARCYALTRPRDAPAEAMLLSHAVLEAAAGEYDRLTGGRLAEHADAAPPAMGSDDGGFPFAWAVLRLRQQIGRPGWSWLRQDDDGLAALHVAAFQHFLHCWGRHSCSRDLRPP